MPVYTLCKHYFRTNQKCDKGNSLPIAFDDIYKIVCRGAHFPYRNVSIVDLVLAENGFDFVLVDVRQRHRVRDCYPSTLLLSQKNLRWFLIQANTKAFQFGFNECLVSERFEDIEYDEDQVTGASN